MGVNTILPLEKETNDTMQTDIMRQTEKMEQKILRLQKDLERANARAVIDTLIPSEGHEGMFYTENEGLQSSSPQTNVNILSLHFTNIPNTGQFDFNDLTFNTSKPVPVAVVTQAQLDKIPALNLASKEKLQAFYEAIRDEIITPEVAHGKISKAYRQVIGLNLCQNSPNFTDIPMSALQCETLFENPSQTKFLIKHLVRTEQGVDETSK